MNHPTMLRNRRPLALRAKRKSAVSAEALEPRTLLSGYSFAVAGTFGPTFGQPQENLVVDGAGNVYGVATSGGAISAGGIFELAHGSTVPALLVSFPANFTSSGLTIDGSGDLYLLGDSLPAGGTEDLSVYELAAGGTSLQNIADLGDNTLPDYAGNLLLDSGGNLYGTALSGGTNGAGEIFEVVKGSGQATLLASFLGGQSPNENLVMDSSGDLFGTTSGGGAFSSGNGTIFELPKGSGTINTIYSFNGTATGANPTGLVMDSKGDLFGSRMNDNTYDPTTIGSIFELPAGGTSPTVLASFSAATGYNSYYPLAVDSAGDLFGATEFGGDVAGHPPDGVGVVFELPAGSQTITALHTFEAGSDGASPLGGVSLGANGVLYGTSIGPGSAGTGLVYTLTPGGTGAGTLTGALAGKLPSSTIAGQKVSISQNLAITNSGSTPVSGSVTAKLFLSTGAAVDSTSIPIGSSGKSVKLKAHAHFALNFKINSLPSSVPEGTYYLVAQITDPAGNVSDTASVGTITVAAREVNLSLALSKFATTARGGKKFSETLSISNSGNIAAAGTVPIVVYTSPDGLLDDATQLASVAKKLDVKPGKPAAISLSLIAPANGTSDYLIFVVDPDNTLKEVTPANDTLVSPSKVAFT